ncbi:MAG: F420-dependent methylenetetrahydromethanopterin dehydrogenase [Candidatus Baldrarchaeia archaeon]
MKEVVRVGVVKCGNLGTSTMVELLLDERADREDIDVRVVTSGTKLAPDAAEDAAKAILQFNPDLVIIISPNAALPGPSRAREVIAGANIPTIVISDGPGKKAVKDIEAKGMGYIIIPADAMLGARREFLDPIEMAIFNADIIKVLAVTGVFNIVYQEIDKVIESIKKGEKPELPKIIIDKELATNAAGFENPYARVKAMAAYEMARFVADLTVEGCFVVKERERYIPIVAAAHELMRYAAFLADEAREIEKYGDHVLRMPHHKTGQILIKRKLLEKPAKQ